MKIQIKHSGQLGDIVYAIPAMRFLAERHGADTIQLFIPNDKTADHHQGLQHPGGDHMISQPMFDYLEPLLQNQPYFDSICFIEERSIPEAAIDFDIVRFGALNLSAGNIRDYYAKLFGVVSQQSSRWITPGAAGRQAGECDIIIGRSTRYLNQAIHYPIIDQLALRVGFIGLEREFEAFHARHPQMAIDYLPTANALEACDRIAGASLYIGNQSFFFALAEALQVNRLLEAFEPVPNVTPVGGTTGQFVSTFGLGLLLGSLFGCDLAVAGTAEDFSSHYVLSL